MNISEASAVNALLAELIGPLDDEDRLVAVNPDKTVRDVAFLAERAHAALGAGFSGGVVVARRERLLERLGLEDVGGLHEPRA